MVLSVFRHLGLVANVQPVLDIEDPFWHDDFYDEEEYDSDDNLIERKQPKLVGSALHAVRDGGTAGDDCEVCFFITSHLLSIVLADWIKEDIQRKWNSKWRSDVHWLNEPGQKELAMTQVIYGNDMGSGVWYYSHAAVFVKVPAFGKREIEKRTT